MTDMVTPPGKIVFNNLDEREIINNFNEKEGILNKTITEISEDENLNIECYNDDNKFVNDGLQLNELSKDEIFNHKIIDEDVGIEIKDNYDFIFNKGYNQDNIKMKLSNEVDFKSDLNPNSILNQNLENKLGMYSEISISKNPIFKENKNIFNLKKNYIAYSNSNKEFKQNLEKKEINNRDDLKNNNKDDCLTKIFETKNFNKNLNNNNLINKEKDHNNIKIDNNCFIINEDYTNLKNNNSINFNIKNTPNSILLPDNISAINDIKDNINNFSSYVFEKKSNINEMSNSNSIIFLNKKKKQKEKEILENFVPSPKLKKEKNVLFNMEYFPSEEINSNVNDSNSENSFSDEDGSDKNKKNKSSSKDKKIDINIKTGRWTNEEHMSFLEAIFLFNNNWKKVQQHIKTRSSTQARSHAQKFFISLKKKILEEFENLYNNNNKTDPIFQEETTKIYLEEAVQEIFIEKIYPDDNFNNFPQEENFDEKKEKLINLIYTLLISNTKNKRSFFKCIDSNKDQKKSRKNSLKKLRLTKSSSKDNLIFTEKDSINSSKNLKPSVSQNFLKQISLFNNNSIENEINKKNQDDHKIIPYNNNKMNNSIDKNILFSNHSESIKLIPIKNIEGTLSLNVANKNMKKTNKLNQIIPESNEIVDNFKSNKNNENSNFITHQNENLNDYKLNLNVTNQNKNFNTFNIFPKIPSFDNKTLYINKFSNNKDENNNKQNQILYYSQYYLNNDNKNLINNIETNLFGNKDINNVNINSTFNKNLMNQNNNNNNLLINNLSKNINDINNDKLKLNENLHEKQIEVKIKKNNINNSIVRSSSHSFSSMIDTNQNLNLIKNKINPLQIYNIDNINKINNINKFNNNLIANSKFKTNIINFDNNKQFDNQEKETNSNYKNLNFTNLSHFDMEEDNFNGSIINQNIFKSDFFSINSTENKNHNLNNNFEKNISFTEKKKFEFDNNKNEIELNKNNSEFNNKMIRFNSEKINYLNLSNNYNNNKNENLKNSVNNEIKNLNSNPNFENISGDKNNDKKKTKCDSINNNIDFSNKSFSNFFFNDPLGIDNKNCYVKGETINQIGKNQTNFLNNFNNLSNKNQLTSLKGETINHNKYSNKKNNIYTIKKEDSSINKNLINGFSNKYNNNLYDHSDKSIVRDCQLNLSKEFMNKDENNFININENKNEIAKLKFQTSNIDLIKDMSQKLNKYGNPSINIKNNNKVLDNFLNNQKYFKNEKNEIINNNLDKTKIFSTFFNKANKIEEKDWNNRFEMDRKDAILECNEDKNFCNFIESKEISKNKIFTHSNNMNNFTINKNNFFNLSDISENSTNYENISKNNTIKIEKNSLEYQNIDLKNKESLKNQNSTSNFSFTNKNNSEDFIKRETTNNDQNLKNKLDNHIPKIEPHSFQNNNFTNHNHNNYINIFNINLMQPKDLNIIPNSNLADSFKKNQNNFNEISKNTSSDNFSENMKEVNKNSNSIFLTQHSKNEYCNKNDINKVPDSLISPKKIINNFRIPNNINQNNNQILSNSISKDIFDDKKNNCNSNLIFKNSKNNNPFKLSSNENIQVKERYLDSKESNLINKFSEIEKNKQSHQINHKNLLSNNYFYVNEYKNSEESLIKDEIINEEIGHCTNNQLKINFDNHNNFDRKSNNLFKNINNKCYYKHFMSKSVRKESRDDTLNPFNLNFDVEDDNKYIDNVNITNNNVYSDYINNREEDEFLGFDIFPN